MSKSDRIPVSREVLDTMLDAVVQTRDKLVAVFPEDPFEQGRLLAQLATKMIDVQLALESLCSRQI